MDKKIYKKFFSSKKSVALEGNKTTSISDSYTINAQNAYILSKQEQHISKKLDNNNRNSLAPIIQAVRELEAVKAPSSKNVSKVINNEMVR